VPTGPEVGLKLAINGTGAKLTPLLATPPTVTTTLPAVAPVGIGTSMPVPLQKVDVAAVPLKVTVLVPCVDPKLVPVIVMEVPITPELGFRRVIVGEVLTLVMAHLNAAMAAPQLSAAPKDTPADTVPDADCT